MKRFVFLLLLFVDFSSMAQFKNLEDFLFYKRLRLELEPTKQVVRWDFCSTWMDTLVSIKREVADYFSLEYPLDFSVMAKIENKTATEDDLKKARLINLIESLPSIEVSIDPKKKKKRKPKQHYDKQRLVELVDFFDQAKQDTNLVSMESVLQLFELYYQRPSFISDERLTEEYKERFFAMRSDYKNIVFDLFAKKKCSRREMSTLYGFSLNAWPDMDLAYTILKTYFHQEWLYLFGGVMITMLETDFVSVCECYVSMLYLYNVANEISISMLIRGFDKIQNFPKYHRDKGLVTSNLRMYLNDHYKVSPQGLLESLVCCQALFCA